MGDMRNYGANGVVGITLVLFIMSTHIAAYVPPVTNVTLSCHNFNNVLYWNYSDSSLAPSFRVNIGAFYSKSSLVDSPNLQADVSFLNNVEEYYSLTVTAVIGGNESDPSPAINFSYNSDFPLGQICFVDFPLVNVTVQSDHTVSIRFLHPSLSYPQMPREKRKKKKLTEFTYHVSLTESQREHDFSCEKRVCEEKLPVEDSEESHCVRINGWLNLVAVRAPQDYCAQAPADPLPSTNFLLSILCPLLVCCVICLVSWMLYRKLTSGSSPLPAFMAFTDKINPFGTTGRSPLTVEQTPVSPVQSTSPGTTPLLPTEEAEEFTFVDTQTEPEVRLRIGAMQLDRSMSSGLEERLGDGEGYALGKALDVGEGNEGEGDSFSQDNGGYEQRPNLVKVEMVQGDQVKGYRG